jgi:hypothetical protein
MQNDAINPRMSKFRARFLFHCRDDQKKQMCCAPRSKNGDGLAPVSSIAAAVALVASAG